MAENREGAAFGAVDWGLLATCATLWGSSFLLIEIGLDAFPPALVSLLRVVFGFATLVALPGVRGQRIERRDWVRVVALGVTWLTLPMLLFPLAQQYIDSSLTGMLNGALPLFAAAIAALIARRLPSPRLAFALLVGFGGILLIGIPAASGAAATALGSAMVLAAVTCYGIAINLAVPLQRRYGGLPVLVRAQAVALVLIAPFGLSTIPDATPTAAGWAAIAVLGIGGTAIAFVAMATLAGRVGAARSSIATYLIPVVAIALGVIFLDESVALTSLAGTAVILLGAYLTSRAQPAKATAADEEEAVPVGASPVAVEAAS